MALATGLVPVTVAIGAFVLTLCACIGQAAPSLITPDEVNSVGVANRALGSVVTVTVKLRPEAVQPGGATKEVGSGFFVAPALILTNAHVIRDEDGITVRLRDGRVLPARLRAIDLGLDIALLRVDGVRAPPLAWGDSSALLPGQKLIVLGSPEGLAGSVSVGVFSSSAEITQPDDQLGAEIPRMLLTDARIVGGNSGGPVLDARGLVVGVAAANLREGSVLSARIGLAIPSRAARAAVEDLIRYGVPQRGFLGASLQDVGDLDPLLRTQAGLRAGEGAMVLEVEPDSPAERAGLRGAAFDAGGRLERFGEVILAVDGGAVRSARDVTRALALRRVPQVVTLRVWRDGNTRDLRLELRARP